eukprot:1011237-Prymnesium_polylepis.1
MGVESATEANECAHCYAFDAARIATRATCRPHPRTAERPANCRATRQPRQIASRRRGRRRVAMATELRS